MEWSRASHLGRCKHIASEHPTKKGFGCLFINPLFQSSCRYIEHAFMDDSDVAESHPDHSVKVTRAWHCKSIQESPARFKVKNLEGIQKVLKLFKITETQETLGIHQ
jgi:hypothetical protein